jgi:type VI protein secretion system component VasF
MTGVHRYCDQELAAVDEAVSEKDWPEASRKWKNFSSETMLHFAREGGFALLLKRQLE